MKVARVNANRTRNTDELLDLGQEIGNQPRLDDLRETAAPERLADIALERVEHGVRAVCGAIVLGKRVVARRDVGGPEVAAWLKANPLGDDSPAFGGNSADRLFPVRVALDADGCGRVGWLLLGPRPDGTLFGKDEREVLSDIADPLARSLTIAAARQQDATRRQREMGRLRTLLTAHETRLASVEVKLA